MQNTFTTSDLNLAAFLLARGHELRYTVTTDPERMGFVLAPEPSIDDLAGYSAGTATVEIAPLLRWQRHLKRLVFGAQGRGGRR